jgi:hypothetical protein
LPIYAWLNCLVGPAQNTEQEAHEQLSYAFDLGVNALDTAEIYPVRPTLPEGLRAAVVCLIAECTTVTHSCFLCADTAICRCEAGASASVTMPCLPPRLQLGLAPRLLAEGSAPALQRRRAAQTGI